ncbi:hypothetical protein G6F43_003551 [Rhizopus delemar]|nr:hypothetical protein G6F43_003551 [Rhizopus delemar]
MSSGKKSGSDSADWDALREFLPTSFGKKEERQDFTKEFEKTKRETAAIKPKSNTEDRKNGTKEQNQEDFADSEDGEESEVEVGYSFSESPPVSHEIKLNDHFRAVSALTLDPAGTRLISGGYDYDIKFWDFAGMDRSFKPFRTVQPCEEHQIHELQYSNSGDSFLVVAGNNRPKIFNRDGFEKSEYAKGDPYIRDLRHTDGHVGALTSGAWHPNDRQSFSTSSQDGTIREWDVEKVRKQKTTIVYKSRERGGRSPCTALAYSPDAKLIAGAYQDGTLQFWNTNSLLRPAVSIADAHQKGTETSSILFSKDNRTVVTRGGDDTIKLWDIRNAKKPVKVAYNLDIVNPEVNVIFSPDERLILTELVSNFTTDVTQSSVIKVLWHPRINQIITGSADGIVSVYYSPTHSQRGAKLCVVKAAKKRAIDDYELDRPIITPHALPMFKEDEARTSSRKRNKLRNDPKASHRPDLPVNGPGKGGRVNMNQQQAVIKSFAKDTTRDEDPREALLKYADVAETDPVWVSNVYKKTQPKPVFAEEEEEEDEESKD